MKNYVLNMAKDYGTIFKMGAKWCKNYWLSIIIWYVIVYCVAYGMLYHQHSK